MCASATAAPALCCWKPKASVLSQRWWWRRRREEERGGEKEEADLLIVRIRTIEMGQRGEERGEGGGMEMEMEGWREMDWGGRLSNLV